MLMLVMSVAAWTGRTVADELHGVNNLHALSRMDIAFGPLGGVTSINEELLSIKPHWGGRAFFFAPFRTTIGWSFRAVPHGDALDHAGKLIGGYYWSTGPELTWGLCGSRYVPYLLLSPEVGQFRGNPGPTTSVGIMGLGGGVAIGIGGGARLRVEGRYSRYWADASIFDGATNSRTSAQEWTLGIDMPFRRTPSDTDFDGVRDEDDLCRGTPIGVQVSVTGCPLDNDLDGVPNGLDLCPTTPAGAIIDRLGCALDGDGDAVPDGIDQCPETAAGILVDRQGCPADADGDGVPNGRDLCTGTAEGATVDENGCPPPPVPESPSSRVADALRTPVSIDASSTPIADVLRFLGQQTGISLVVDSSVDGMISLHVEEMAGADALELIVAAAGMTYYWDRGAVVVTTPAKLKESGALQSVPLAVRHVRANDLLDPLSTLLGEDQIKVGPRGQQIIVTSTPDVIAQARSLVEAMDQPLPQVAIEVRVVEIAVDRLRQLGLRWTAERQGSSMLTGIFQPPLAAQQQSGVVEFNKLTSAYALDVTLEALERRGQARILASPRLMTLSGHPARILIGDRIPYFTTQYSDDGTREVIVDFVEVGVRLDLVPDVQADHSITTHVRTEVSSIVSFRGPLDEIPWVKTREAEATVRVERDQWVSLGGLLRREERKATVSVPILGDVPILGQLFQSHSTENVETEVVIMLSPTLVNP